MSNFQFPFISLKVATTNEVAELESLGYISRDWEHPEEQGVLIVSPLAGIDYKEAKYTNGAPFILVSVAKTQGGTVYDTARELIDALKEYHNQEVQGNVNRFS